MIPTRSCVRETPMKWRKDLIHGVEMRRLVKSEESLEMMLVDL